MLATLALAAAAIAPCEIDALEVRGLHRVRLEVVEELLPRSLPTCLREDELAESTSDAHGPGGTSSNTSASGSAIT